MNINTNSNGGSTMNIREKLYSNYCQDAWGDIWDYTVYLNEDENYEVVARKEGSFNRIFFIISKDKVTEDNYLDYALAELDKHIN